MASSRAAHFKIDAMVRQAREPGFVLDAGCKLAFVNSAFEAFTGCSSETVLGTPCSNPGADRTSLAASLQPPPEALLGQPCGGASLFHTTGGERIWRKVEFWPWHDPKGERLGILGLVRPMDAPAQAPESDWQRTRIALLDARDLAYSRHGFDSLIGRGPAHDRLLEQVHLASGSRMPILIVGESGTGKHTVARAIHRQGIGRGAPFLPFDVEALPIEVLDRELFGSDQGTSRGLNFRPESTVILGDVLRLPRDLQAKLATALEHRDGPRLIATTAGDLDEARRAGTFRDDLFHALSPLILRLTPLRQRLDELPLLAAHLLEKANLRVSRHRAGFRPQALDVFMAYDWPGNLREFARVIDHAHSTGDSVFIEVDDLPLGIRGHQAAAYLPPPEPPAQPLDQLLNELERHLIEHALKKGRQNKSKAADLLGISRPRLYRRIKELEIPDEGGEEPEEGV